MSEQDKPTEATYVRRPQDYMPGTAEEQGAVARAELAARGWDVAPPADGLWDRLFEEMDRYDLERVRARLGEFRPYLVAEVGEPIVRQLLEHRALMVWLQEMEERGVDADEAAREAAVYLRDHPSESPADAFTAVRDKHPEQ
ncbi:hypothetical protein [Streptomyces sp. DH37]|uniref:hypothetical protein n=1 Tax=Streptomyces sp. DH37 TaxID=3040122 RepID=UPI002440F528|nr:hypothetical protein [Streptomyces sp. DH37]MDG9703727.1 hypothetical protein [Streptomyces sp. DH37]